MQRVSMGSVRAEGVREVRKLESVWGEGGQEEREFERTGSVSGEGV